MRHSARSTTTTGIDLARRQSDAESAFLQALEIARRQSARMDELETAVSLSRLWRSQGKRDEARDLLSEVYDWFTEGLDTADPVRQSHVKRFFWRFGSDKASAVQILDGSGPTEPREAIFLAFPVRRSHVKRFFWLFRSDEAT